MRDERGECGWKVRTWGLIRLRNAVEISGNHKSPSSEIGVTYVKTYNSKTVRVSGRSVSETKPKSPKFRPDISESESDKRGEDFLFSFSFLFSPFSVCWKRWEMWDWNEKGFAFCDSLFFKMRGSYCYLIAVLPQPPTNFGVGVPALYFLSFAKLSLYLKLATERTNKHSAMWSHAHISQFE